MKVAIATVQVPFTTGGAEIHASMLKNELVKRGYQADIVALPFKWYPKESLLNSMMMGRMMDLSEANGEKIDRVIAIKFPAYYIRHENKVLWLEHQHRQAYDMWDTQYSDLRHWENAESIRDLILRCDQTYIAEAKKVYTIAGNTTNRLKKYCNIDSTVLYQPPLNHDKFYCDGYGDYIYYPSRINSIKRQRLLIEALLYTETDVKVVLSGGGVESELDYINTFIREHNLENRVRMAGYVSVEEKLKLYGQSLGVYFGAFDEDYGYITLEAFFAEKSTIVHKDAGGPLEFVEDGVNGFVIDSSPLEIAKKMDYLYSDRGEAERMGKNARQSLKEKNLEWDYIIDCLLN